MDFENLNMKFGEDTKWIMKTKCPWCDKPIHEQTEARFKQKGNMCDRCSANITKRVQEHNYERDITETERLIKQTRLEMDTIALRLEENISEQEAKRIYDELEKEFIKIKMLKGI